MNINDQNPLANLKDIHLPGVPEFWPPAFGWWLLFALTLLCLAWFLIRLSRFLKIHKKRKQLLQHLEKINHEHSIEENHLFLSSASILLRRIAIMNYPRDLVADLVGEQWTEFLDQSGNTDQFSKGAGAIIANGPYEENIKFNRDELILIIQKWIKRNAHV